MAEQENEIKSSDVANVFYENIVVKGIFSKENKNISSIILKNEDDLHNIHINFYKNGQIIGIEKIKLNSFHKDGKLDLGILKN